QFHRSSSSATSIKPSLFTATSLALRRDSRSRIETLFSPSSAATERRSSSSPRKTWRRCRTPSVIPRCGGMPSSMHQTRMRSPPSLRIMEQPSACPLRIPSTAFAASRFRTLTATSCSSGDPGTQCNLNDVLAATLPKPALLAAEPQLFVTDVRAACDFYTKKLGFTVAFMHGEPPFYGQVFRDGARLNIRHLDEPAINPDFRDEEQLLSASITVEDARRLFLEFQTAGVLFHQTLKTEPW